MKKGKNIVIFAQQQQDLFGLKKDTSSQMLPSPAQRYSETFIWMFAIIQKYTLQIIMAAVGEKLAQLKIIVTSKVSICAQFHMKWIMICICQHCHSASTEIYLPSIICLSFCSTFSFKKQWQTQYGLNPYIRYFNTKFDNEMHWQYHLAK